MANVALIFDRGGDQVARIGHRIAEYLRDRGHHVVLTDLDSILTTFSLRSFDGAIIGGRARFGRFSHALRKFAVENRPLLERMQAWLFAVERGGQPADAARRIQRLEDQTGWWPQRVGWLDCDWTEVRNFALAFTARLHEPPAGSGVDSEAQTLITARPWLPQPSRR